MPFTIPLQAATPHYRFNTPLEGVRYLFDIRWNAREAAWYFDLLAEDETPIVSGIKILLGVLLGRRCVSDAFPNGVFVAFDTASTGRDATYDDLGTRVTVLYFTRSEFDATVAIVTL